MAARMQITTALLRCAHAELMSRHVTCSPDFDEAMAHPIQSRYVRCMAVGMACKQASKRPPAHQRTNHHRLPTQPYATDCKRAAAGDFDD